ncbi:class I SAM-dependent methyltransferase [Nocardia sp. NPDC059091]|uniref:class I SAM-dependent methyltransferase n=1 Tax=unclassified Nocardia TaxID=2637762 RepID=UPI0036AEAC53
MIFAEPARLLAESVATADAVDILETAAGTGALTRELARLGGHNIVSTDLNEPMVTAAAARLVSERVHWQVADAQSLPFPDRSFDVVVCQFGAMFLPDKVRGYAEARRRRPVRWRSAREPRCVAKSNTTRPSTSNPQPRSQPRNCAGGMGRASSTRQSDGCRSQPGGQPIKQHSATACPMPKPTRPQLPRRHRYRQSAIHSAAWFTRHRIDPMHLADELASVTTKLGIHETRTCAISADSNSPARSVGRAGTNENCGAGASC